MLPETLSGCATTPAAFFGNFLAGVIVKKLRLPIKGLAAMCIVVCGISTLLTPLNFAVGCDNAPIAGVTVLYPGQTEYVHTLMHVNIVKLIL